MIPPFPVEGWPKPWGINRTRERSSSCRLGSFEEPVSNAPRPRQRPYQEALTRMGHVVTMAAASINAAGVQRTATIGDKRPRRRNPSISAAARLTHRVRTRAFTARLLLFWGTADIGKRHAATRVGRRPRIS